MIDTNETLLDRLKAGEAHDAWQEFYKAYWSAILRYARKLGLNATQAQEVLQETMVALMRILPGFTYDPRKGRFRNFLLTIVHRQSLAALRRARRNQNHDSLDSRAPWAENRPLSEVLSSPLSQTEQTEASHRWHESLVEDALARLRDDETVDQRTYRIFQAYVIENKPARTVAVEFGLQENAIYQIKNRLMRRLQAEVARLMRDSGAPE
jgi:RNA polymerase sigma-70 factor (ECF subfamily)